MLTLLLLAATVRSFAHMPLGISDRNSVLCVCRNELVLFWSKLIHFFCRIF